VIIYREFCENFGISYEKNLLLSEVQMVFFLREKMPEKILPKRVKFLEILSLVLYFFKFLLF
jgi:hypothetical protein